MATFLYKLGHVAVRKRRLVVAVWIALLIGLGALSSGLGGETTDSFSLPGTESQEAFDLLERRFPAVSGSSTQVVFAGEGEGSLLEGPAAAAIADSMTNLAEVAGVEEAASPAESGTIAQDGRIAFGVVRYPVGPLEVDEETLAGIETAVEPAREAGLAVEFGGEVIPGLELEPPSSEALGLGVAVIVLLLSFGSILAMGLPLVTALIGLGIGVSGIGILSAFTELSSVAPTLAIMIGLAVGIDYALFIVTRHRQNVAHGIAVEESAARANATAGSAVVFAGLTVVIALAGLAVVGIPFLTVMGVAAAATVLVAVLVAVTLLPALLGFTGRNIDRFRVPGLKNRTGGIEESETLGARWAAKVTTHPVLALVAGVAVMAFLAVPLASMRLGLTDAGTAAPQSTQRKAYDLLAEGFGPGFNGPLTVVVDLADADDPEAAVAAVGQAVGAADNVAIVAPANVNPEGDTAVVPVIPLTGPSTAETDDLVHTLRSEVIPRVEEATATQVSITGSAAVNIDISDKMGAALLPFMALVIGLTVLLLMVVFRSILVPLKAALAILVSIGSAFGVVVAIFQWGWLADLVGLEETIPIVSFLPIMMFAILFGLSMDYEVFILSRVREEFSRTGDPRGSVLTGIAASARVITAAALIMVSVFGAFVLGDDPMIKMFGIGLSTAVLLDATIVRMVIVPAAMTLFDRAAWWLPGWLDRLLPNIDVEGDRLLHVLEAHDRAVADDDAGDEVVAVPVSA